MKISFNNMKRDNLSITAAAPTRTSSTVCFDESVSVVDSNSGVVGAFAGLARRPCLAF